MWLPCIMMCLSLPSCYFHIFVELLWRCAGVCHFFKYFVGTLTNVLGLRLEGFGHLTMEVRSSSGIRYLFFFNKMIIYSKVSMCFLQKYTADQNGPTQLRGHDLFQRGRREHLGTQPSLCGDGKLNCSSRGPVLWHRAA